MKTSNLRILTLIIYLLFSSIIITSCDDQVNNNTNSDTDNDSNITVPTNVIIAATDMIKRISSDVKDLYRLESNYKMIVEQYEYSVLFIDKLDPKLGFNKIVEVIIKYDTISLKILESKAIIMSTNVGLSGENDANNGGFNLTDSNSIDIDRNTYKNYWLQKITLEYLIPSIEAEIIDGNNTELNAELYMAKHNSTNNILSLLRIKTEGKAVNNIDYVIDTTVLATPIIYQYK